MKLSDLILMSLTNLTRRKGRTALTVIGVVVGTCAIVVMISLGLAMNKNNESMLASWGDLTQIQIYNYGGYYVNDVYQGSGDPLNDEVVNSIRGWDHVVSASPFYQPDELGGRISVGKRDRYQTPSLYSIYGAYPDALEALGVTLSSGKYMSDDTNVGKNKIPVIVGENFGYSFQDTKRSERSPKRYVYSGQTDANGNPVSPFVDIDRDTMTLTLSYTDGDKKEKTESWELVVVGVMQSNYSVGYYTDNGMIMRLKDVQMLTKAYKKLSGSKDKSNKINYGEVYVKCDSVDTVADVEQKIKDLGYSTYSMTQIRAEMQGSVAQSQMILGGLAAISLLVAALNIANTMTMAIYERTREIGVMKVLGCELWHIRAMFLVESGAIGFLGGAVGVVFSLIISFVMNNIAMIASLFGASVDLSGMMSSMSGGWGSLMGASGSSTISIVPLWLILLALGFATMVGLLSGIAPAGKAVKISSLEAIRHE